jgi:Xaa-Pro aminopeptidase
VREFLQAKGLDAFVFSRRSSFAWLTDGGESSVDEASEVGAADLILTPERAYVVAPNNEMDRLMEEVLGDQGYEPVTYSWREDRISIIEKLLHGRATGSDILLPGCREFYREVKTLRYALLPGEQERMRFLGKETARIVGEVCRQIRPGDSEIKIAATIKGNLAGEGIAAPVILVAADGRIAKYRHPVPTNKEVEHLVMVVVCARRWGLTVALTRMVYFGSVPQDLKQRFTLVNAISARLINATTPGKEVKEIFYQAMQAYTEVGYPGEWEKHHQGGPIGYDTRDYLAYPECEGIVYEGQGFAWNPILVEVKSEDTILALAGGSEIITIDEKWPAEVFVRGETIVRRPGILLL